MKKLSFLILGILCMSIALAIAISLVQAAPQTGNDRISEDGMMQQAFVATDGTVQVVVLGRGVPTPQTGNDRLSMTQMMQQAFVAADGTFQAVLDESSSGIPFINTTSLTDGDVLKYDTTGTEWINTEGQVTIDDNNDMLVTTTSPAFTLYNTTEQDTDGGRASGMYAKGEQSGGEVSTLGSLVFSHYLTSDDQKGRFRFYLNDGNDGNTPSLMFGVNPTGFFTDRFATASDTNTVFGINAVGGAALAHTTGNTGWYNTVYGNRAGLNLAAGHSNTLIGFEAGVSIAATNATIGLGYSAARSSGGADVAIGYNAGYYPTGGSNVFAGYRAGAGGSAGAAANNVCIGYQACDSVTTGSSNIMIGYDVDLASATTSNTINIGNVFKGNISTGLVTLPAYTRSMTIPANSSVLGPTAPTLQVVGTYAGYMFDADAEAAYPIFEVPDDWNGTSNMTFKVYWTNEAGDAIADGETVKFDVSYRSKADTEDLDAGTAATGTVTYTQSGGGTDGALHESSITLTYNDANQPLTSNDVVGIAFDRDVTADTYSGGAIVLQWEVDYTSVSIPKHD